MKVVERLKRWAGRLKAELYALYLAYRDPRVPLYARVFAACVVGYAFSPIDLIPDPIPVLGSLDDLVLIPLGVTLAIKMIPAPVLAECREKARRTIEGRPTSRTAAAVIVALWLSGGAGDPLRGAGHLSAQGSTRRAPRYATIREVASEQEA